MPETTIESSSYKTYEKVINPTTDGTYYIGLHAKSSTEGFFLFVNSLRVTPEALTTAPDSVTNLKAVADQSGDLKATITFNAPTKAINGTALSALTKIVVKSGSRTVGTLTAPQPGQACTVTDENASLGNNTYDVMPYNESDGGVSSSVTVKVGPDVPGAPVVKAIDYTDKVKLDWDDVAGANGGIIIPKKVTYNIYELTSDGYVSTKLGSTLGGVTEYMVSNVNTATGDVQLTQAVGSKCHQRSRHRLLRRRSHRGRQALHPALPQQFQGRLTGKSVHWRGNERPGSGMDHRH